MPDSRPPPRTAPDAAPANSTGGTAIASMTGFARAEGASSAASWAVEIRSVNGRALDLRCRVPPGFDELEAALRPDLQRRIRRGSVQVTVTLDRSEGRPRLTVNRALLAELMAIARELQDLGAAPPRLDGLLAIRGVLDSETADKEGADRETLLAGLRGTALAALDQFQRTREAEGARLVDVLENLLAEIASTVAQAEGLVARRPSLFRERLTRQLDQLFGGEAPISEDRIAQEVALLVVKGDVREELDRMRAHVSAAREALAEGGGVGRRLDFLAQELNREANTLCAKSTDLDLTRLGLGLKGAIDQFKEQVQNLE